MHPKQQDEEPITTQLSVQHQTHIHTLASLINTHMHLPKDQSMANIQPQIGISGRLLQALSPALKPQTKLLFTASAMLVKQTARTSACPMSAAMQSGEFRGRCLGQYL